MAFDACLSRKLYSYAKGVDSEDVDPSAFKSAYKEFTDSGYRLRALLKGLVRRVRSKVDIDPDQPSLIKTVAGGGYLFSS